MNQLKNALNGMVEGSLQFHRALAVEATLASTKQRVTVNGDLFTVYDIISVCGVEHSYGMIIRATKQEDVQWRDVDSGGRQNSTSSKFEKFESLRNFKFEKFESLKV